MERDAQRASIKRPITCPESTFDYLTVLSMPQVSFEFLQIASLSRRRHGFDSRTGRQSYQSMAYAKLASISTDVLIDDKVKLLE
jgi:hypothetical protein